MMLAPDLSALRDHYDQIVLSPHFDDAALSIGGAIAAWSEGGAPLVVTICSAPPSGPLSAFAAHLHARWGDATDPIAVRRAEDAAALTLLGADVCWLEAHDAIYRGYESLAAIFGAPHSEDPLPVQILPVLEQLRARFPAARWYAPLAIGGHVDHRVVHDMVRTLAKSGWPVSWYEDLPYAARGDAFARREAEGVLEGLSPDHVAIDTTLTRKLAAIAAYASQMLELFGDEAAMYAEITAYAQHVAPPTTATSERLWKET